MTINISKNTQQWIKAGALSILVCVPNFAFAVGGLDSAKGQLTTIKDWILDVYVVVATIYLIWKAWQAKSGKGNVDWQDFGVAVAWVAVAGAAGTIATWAFTAFKS